ncbi:MAG: metal-dependent hydrolase [Saprospiraceae bacterium]
MRGPNHIVGGGVLTGTFASLFFGINIFTSPFLIAGTLIGSLLPDIDHTSSLPGKLFYPLAKQINRRYGHRTLTHGLPFLAILTGFSMMIESLYSSNWNFSIVLCIAVFVHVLLDMMTVSGVKLMYPFQKDRIYVMIGRKDFRMRVDDIRAESIAMAIFLGMWLLLLPLIQNGFWTTYNTYFGKPQHLVSEFQNATDLLAVDYQIKRGSQIVQGNGFCIEASTSKIVLLEGGQWNILDSKVEIIEKVVPIHTGKHFRFQAINLIEISADSLNQICRDRVVANLQISANNKFQFQTGLQEQAANKYQGEYLNQITFSTIEQEIELETFIDDHSYLPRIKLLEQKIAVLQAEQKRKELEFRTEERQLATLKTQYTTASNAEKELLLPQIRKLEKITAPISNALKVTELQNQIIQIRSVASIKNQKRKTEIELRNKETLAGQQETKFTGVLMTVLIEE